MKKYIMSIDAGTSSNRCFIYDIDGNIKSSAQKEFSQFYPKPGWVEHDPMEIWGTVIGVAKEAMAKINASPNDIASIGITNQRETTVVWDRKTGMPVYNAIVWQCRRSLDICDRLKSEGLTDMVCDKTGLFIDAYFSATKLKWILDNVEGARARAENGELLFGTVDTWLIWNLTAGRSFVTDFSNAARTMLFNIRQLCWDDDILKLLDIPKVMLPKVLPTSCNFGQTESELFGAPINIGGDAGDQQAALFGQGCFSSGDAKNTYGTGCFMLMNTGTFPVKSKRGLLTTIAWGLDGKVNYALEGSVFIAGAAIQWLRDEMGLISTAAECEKYAKMTDDTAGCYVVPAFSGLGTPYWDRHALGAIVGLSRGVNRNHIIRATVESLAYQTCDVLHAMEEDSGVRLASLYADGGASANDFLMQFQSDISGVPVLLPKTQECTSFGVAALAALSCGFWADENEVKKKMRISKSFSPLMTREKREELMAGWHIAVKRVMN